MALIKLGGLAQDVRGSLAGTTFSRNRGGAYVRQKISPCQPITPFNSAARAIFKALSQRWATALTDIQRIAWEAFAALHPYTNVFGDSLILSGIAIFQAVNRRARQCGEDWIDDVPLTFNVQDLGAVAATVTIDAGLPTTATLTPTSPMYGGIGLYVFSTLPARWTQKPQRPDFRLVNNPTDGLIASADDFSAQLITRFPAANWITGQFVHMRVQALDPNTGASSAPVALKIELTD